MNSSPLKVAAATEDRTDEQAARAAPVSLPAGSYDLSTLTKSLDQAALAKNDGKRDGLVVEAVEKANETPRPQESFGVPPGYKRVPVADEVAGVEEDRVVFDTEKREEAEAAQEDYQPAVDPAKDAPASTKKGD